MKQFLRAVLLSVLFICSVPKAKATQEQNQLVFDRVKTFINDQAIDSIYAMLTDDFKKKVPAETFKGFMIGSIFPLGKIDKATLVQYKDGVSTYNVDFATARQSVMIAGNDDGKISGLRFKPVTDATAVPRKDYKAATTNPLKTVFDKSIDSIATEYISLKNTVGLQIGVWKDEKTYTYGYGETAKGNGKIPDANTLFEIGSITKTFTGTLLAYYVNEGKIQLSDPIIRYLPDSVAANKGLKGITIQMLSNHTSGLPSVPLNMDMSEQAELNPYKGYDRAKMYSFLESYSNTMQPGQQYGYSNLAVGLLGTILEDISGLAYEQMVKKVIADPLDMEHTVQHIMHDDINANITSVYNEEGKEVQMWDFDVIAAAGCLRSTMSDLLRYAAANIEPSKKLGKAMQLAHTKTYDKGTDDVGLGWHFISAKGNTLLWHNGGTGGSRSFLAFDPKKRFAIVVLSNSAESVDETGIQLIKLMLR
ncbi:MAG: hypothetical protein EOP56_01830 [Sphingobacteriales bacterium]|nr:MAG: hypothetical protein EOP56_01830 [Sphingobacteriales bacterium]